VVAAELLSISLHAEEMDEIIACERFLIMLRGEIIQAQRSFSPNVQNVGVAVPIVPGSGGLQSPLCRHWLYFKRQNGFILLSPISCKWLVHILSTVFFGQIIKVGRVVEDRTVIIVVFNIIRLSQESQYKVETLRLSH
jgi:hypothetical protein